ncbi:MAG: MFS transporter [Cytophagaceae bacterium]|jgi:MFS family permease|nr:MFS transporter [Cytophagaceae bacterium]
MSITTILRKTFSALYHKDYKNFWVGQAISTVGGMIQVTALSWYVYQISGSPFLLGLMGVFEFGPVLLLTLFAGVLIERFPKKKILLVTQIVFMIQSLTLAVLVWQGVTSYWVFAMLALVAGTTMSIEQPTRQSYFVELVGKIDLPNAISLNSTTFNLARIIGPMIAGIIMKYLGTAQCFLINGLSFIPVLYGINLISVVGKPRLKNVKKNVLSEIKEGVLYTVRNEKILPTFLIVLVIGIFAMNYNVILPVLAKDVLQGDEHTYSTLMSLFGLGSLLGALFMGSAGKDIRSKNFLVTVALSIGALQMASLLFAHSFIIVASFLIALGFLSLCFLNRANTRIQLNIDDKYRSRVMSIYVLVVTGSTPLGNTFTGWAMDTAGKSYGFFIDGVIAFTVVMILFIVYRNYLMKAKVVSDKDKIL